MKKYILATLATVTIAGCSSTPETKAAPTNMSADQALVASTGLNVVNAANEVDQQGFNTVTDAGLAAGMVSDFGAAGLGLGLLGVLSSPGPSFAAQPHILTTIPAGIDPASRSYKYSEAAYRASGLNPEAQGYKRVISPMGPNAVVFIKDGCPVTKWGYHKRSCSIVFHGHANKPTKATDDTIYIVAIGTTNADVGNYEAFARRIVDQLPSELSLYIPPKKGGGQMQPAKLYRSGKEIALQ